MDTNSNEIVLIVGIRLSAKKQNILLKQWANNLNLQITTTFNSFAVFLMIKSVRIFEHERV